MAIQGADKTGGVRTGGSAAAAPKKDEAAFEQKVKEFPRADSLIEALRNPQLREKLENKIGGELLAKLDKIFNAQPEGVSPVRQQNPLGPTQGTPPNANG